MMDRAQLLRNLPAVEKILKRPDVRKAMEEGVARPVMIGAVRDVIDFLRRSINDGGEVEAAADSIAEAAIEMAGERQRPKIKRVINATGVVLHTNLGRAPMPEAAVRAMAEAAGYCNLEYDLETGSRGSRRDPLRKLLCEITGAEDAAVVNNNAGAVLLTLSALTRGREVVVSRGELVEIGGAFRVPDVMAQSGAKLVEVGTTNKTRASDYLHAIGPDTGALMKIHTSNFRVMGFTEETTLEELVTMGRKHNLWVIEDQGTGLMANLAGIGQDEPLVRRSVAAGADVVTFSGDKLLGGPQAGIIVGRYGAVEAIVGHPLMRALRPDKVTLAALEAVLNIYRDPKKAAQEIPVLYMLGQDAQTLERRALILKKKLDSVTEGALMAEVVADYSEAGGGSLPMTRFETRVVALRGPGLNHIEAELRRFTPPIVARMGDEALVFDPRTLKDEEFEIIARAVLFALEHKEK